MRLDGVRVLDLSRLLPGPYATQLLRDLGADVIKIEDPETGDYARDQPPLTDRGRGRLFEAINRGKRSVGVDLKRARGRELFYRLAGDADVIFEQFRPGVADRLGIDYETICEHNPSVVYCSLSGYGQTGPYADRVGHDLNYVGVGGLLDMTRESPDQAPRIPGYPIADMSGGLFAAFAVVGALASRALGNTDGEYIDVAMTDVVVSLSQAVTAGALAGEDPRPGGTALTGRDPWYDVYEAADGRYLTLAALEPKFWAAFCEAVDRPDLQAVHGTDDPAERSALREELAALFAERSRDDWLDRLADTEAMVGPVNTPRELLVDPQIDARGLVERPDDGAPRIGFPARFSGGPAVSAGPAPGLGEHTDELLGALGVDDSTLEDLRNEGVVA